jgi:short-subunit dehydrogenase
LVTGASSGIGAAYATRLAKLGYALTLVARRKDRLRALAQDLKTNFGAKVDVIAGDLESPAFLSKLEDRFKADHFIGLINNAGAGGLGPIASSSPQGIESNIKLNVIALARLSYAALASFKKQGKGILVNIGSVAAFAPSPAAAVYSGSKAFVVNFTRSIQLEFASTPVRIQLVLPGPIRTEFFSSQGMDGSVFPASSYLSADELVDAAMSGLEKGEEISIPSLQDMGVWENVEELRKQFLMRTLSGIVAERY